MLSCVDLLVGGLSGIGTGLLSNPRIGFLSRLGKTKCRPRHRPLARRIGSGRLGGPRAPLRLRPSSVVWGEPITLRPMLT